MSAHPQITPMTQIPGGPPSASAPSAKSADQTPRTLAQHRRLVCLLRERGLWDDRHQVCGVDSLRDLSLDQAAALITKLAGDRPSRARPRRSILPRLAPGTIRPATDAQRRKIHWLLRQLGWSADTCTHWLWSRHLIGNVDTTPMSTTTAHECITQLDNALKKGSQERRSAGVECSPTSPLHPSDPSPLSPAEVPF